MVDKMHNEDLHKLLASSFVKEGERAKHVARMSDMANAYKNLS